MPVSPQGTPLPAEQSASVNARPRVVIIGSGFGALFAAKALRRAPVDVTIIAKTDHHLFQPLLYQVATGILSQGEIAPSTRDVLKRHRNTEVVLGEVTDIDVDARTVTSVVGELEVRTRYDSLIVAAGAGQSYFGHPEFEEWAPGLKSIDDALELRGRIFGSFEVAELLPEARDRAPWQTFVVVGAGATGVELAGQIRELSRRALKNNYRRIDPAAAKVILLDGGDAVLSAFGDKQSTYARSTLERMGIEVRLGALVTDVDETGVRLKFADGREERIEARCKIWAAGVTASPLAAQLAERTGAETDRSGRVKCLPDLTLPGHPEISVVGDMVALNDYPGVAQVAMQGGKYAARRIKHQLKGKEVTEPFVYFDKGSMATISRFRAVANVGSLRARGFPAWMLWLFIHIAYLVGFFQKISTLGHWTVAFLGRSRTERTFTAMQAAGLQELRALPAQDVNRTGVGLDPPLPTRSEAEAKRPDPDSQ